MTIISNIFYKNFYIKMPQCLQYFISSKENHEARGRRVMKQNISPLCFWATEEVTNLVSLIRKQSITFKLCHRKDGVLWLFSLHRRNGAGDLAGGGGRYSWNRSTEGKKISLVSLHSTLLCVSMLTSNYISCLESLCKSLFISNYIFCLDSLSPWDRSLWTKLIFRIDTLCASPGVEYTWLTVGYLDL